MNVKKLIDKGRCDDGFILNPSMCECECDIGEYLNYADCKCRERLIDKVVLEYKDEILNTTHTTSIAHKKVTSTNNCFIYTISLAIMCLILLAIVSIGYYYYYARYCLKKEYSVSF